MKVHKKSVKGLSLKNICSLLLIHCQDHLPLPSGDSGWRDMAVGAAIPKSP